MFDFISKTFFKNSGKRIQKIAMVFFLIQSIAAVVGSIIMFVSGIITFFDGGFLLCLLSPFAIFPAICVAWFDSIFVYGFGELISNTSKDDTCDSLDLPTSALKSKTILYHCVDCGKLSPDKLCIDCQNIKKNNENSRSEYSPCPVCGADISNDSLYCHVCNAKIDQ